MKRRSFRFQPPLDLASTLAPLRHGAADPTIRLAPGEALRATRTPQGPATLRLVAHGDVVEAAAWGPGSGWALDHAAELIGAHDSPELFRPPDRLLKSLKARFAGLRFCRSGAVTEILVPTIVEQRVTSAEAMKSIHRLTYSYGEPAPGPFDLLLPPDPERLAAAPYWELHRLGIEHRRARFLGAVCRERRRLDALAGRPLDEAAARLLAFVGIGPWSAAQVLSVALGDPDAVVTGDYHFPGIVGWALAREPRATDERMLELLEPYRGQRGRAQRLIVWGCPKPPRRGWKRPLRSIASI